ncbi:MAG TPA: endonuclease domain-containing protein, partial [Rhodothermales bacterium]
MPIKYHHYERGLTARSRRLRRRMTRAEVLLWTRLRSRQLGVGFRRQRPIGSYVVDFFCSRLDLAIEVDGATHDEKRFSDEKRDEYMSRIGITVLRFSDDKVLFDEETVVTEIE